MPFKAPTNGTINKLSLDCFKDFIKGLVFYDFNN